MARWEDAPLVEEQASNPRWASAPLEESPVKEKSKPYEGWGEYAKDLARTAIGQGTGLSYGDEIIAGVRSVLPESLGGADYDTAVKEERAAVDRFSQQNPGTAIAAQLAGGVALPAGPIVAAMRAPTMLGKVARSAGVGAGFGGVSGFGAGEGGVEQRLPSAAKGAVAGAALGAVVPPVVTGIARGAGVVHSAVSPTIARLGENARAGLRRVGIEASADGGIPPNAGAQAAADQIIANQLYRAGKTVDDLEGTLARAQDARRFHTSGVAQDALAPVDLDPSLQRLAGSAARQSPEAAGTSQSFMYARQTGLTPQEGLSPSAGLPHREMLSKPMTGAQAEERFGTRFDTPKDKLVPTGQRERVTDALKRAFQIRDEEFHGHGGNAHRTEQAMAASLKRDADKLYPAAWKNAEDFDLSPAFAQLAQTRAQINDPGVHAVLNRVERLFRRPDGNAAPLGSASELQRLDLAKQRLDGLIDRVKGNDSFLYRELTKFKNTMLDAVHGGDRLNPTRNAAYGEARGFYASQKEMQEAMDLGRAAFRQDSDIGAEVFNALESPAQQKLFRLGFLAEADAKMGNMSRTADITRLFDNPRVQEVLAAIIPRSKKAGDTFANRPERFGQYLGNEKAMVRTQNEISGNSKTAQRLADDEAFEALNGISGAVEKWKNSGSLTMVGVKFVEETLNKMFGMRADTAASLAKSLFTADPQQRAMVLARVRGRMGDSRFQHFSRLVQQYEGAIAPAGNLAGSSAGTPLQVDVYKTRE